MPALISPRKKHFITTAKRPRMPIWPILFTMKGASSPLMTQVVGKKFSQILMLVENGTCEYFLYEEEIKELGDSLLKKIDKNPDQTKIFIKNIFERGEKLVTFARNIDIWAPEKTLARYFGEYEKLYSRLIVLGWPLVIVGEPALVREIKSSLEKIIPDAAERDRVFHIISNPAFSSYTTEETIHLLKLALKLKSGRDVDKELAKHARTYQWTCFDYTGPAHTIAHFSHELRLLAKKKKSALENQLKEISERPRKAQRDLHAILKKYKFEKPLITKIYSLQDLIYIRDKRKEFLTKAHFLMEQLLDEISKRRKIEKEFLRWITTEEFIALLARHKFNQEKIKERIKYCAVFCDRGKEKIFYKTQAKKYFALPEIASQDLTELKGMCACPGKVKARVRVILKAEDGNKLNEGEILVTTMTTVDFAPVMKKAAAIVTDEGGITSHAAVISREFKIPCVIGTRIATQALRDGDLVELDAKKGIIKKL